MVARTSIDGETRRLRRLDLARLAGAGLDARRLLDETVRILRKTIPCEAGCWHILDPATLIETSYKAINLPIDNPLAAEIEYLHDDFNQFATLAHAARHCGILSVATGGAPARSLRYRELIRPSGLEGELRGAFVCDGTAWGSVCLLREHSSRDFTAGEAAFLEDVSGRLGHGVRAAKRMQAATRDLNDPDGPGLVLLDERQRPTAVTPRAARLLRELAEDSRRDAGQADLPYVVHAVAARARLAAREPDADIPARARVRTRTGRWLSLDGCFVASESERRIAVIVEAAAPRALAPHLTDGFGLTTREAEVMRCLFHGLSTRQIAIALRISPYTVQEHFTAIFDKLGVRSRRQLVGKVFRRFFEPRLISPEASRERLSGAPDSPSSPADPSASRSTC